MRKFHFLYKIFSGVFIILLSSCATILNQPVQKIYISKDNRIKDVSIARSLEIDSSLIGDHAPRAYWISRSRDSLSVRLLLDSTEEEMILRPKNSFWFWANIYFNYGIGMLVDKDTKKRYAYPQRNYFFVENDEVHRKRFAPIKKSALQLTLATSLPNNFLLQSDHGKYNSLGPPGLAAGLDYFYKTNQYFSVNIGAAADAFGEHFGPGYFENGYAIYASLRDNRVKGSFDLGYGLNISKLGWQRMTLGDTINRNKSIISTDIGLSLSTQYRLGKYFRIGVLYQPDFFMLKQNLKFDYQHFACVNFVWKFPLNHPSKK